MRDIDGIAFGLQSAGDDFGHFHFILDDQECASVLLLRGGWMPAAAATGRAAGAMLALLSAAPVHDAAAILARVARGPVSGSRRGAASACTGVVVNDVLTPPESTRFACGFPATNGLSES